MRTPQRLAALATAAALAVTLAACSGSGSPDPAADGGPTSITVAQVTEPTRTANPVIDGSLAGYSWYYAVFDSLTILSADGTIEPRLATSWESSDDLETWTFHIRDDVTFHNGDPLTAHDVAFTYGTILDTPDSSPKTYMRPLESVEAIDDATVVFHLNTPFSPFPSVTTSVSIVPEKVWEQLGSEGFAAAPVGSGPYRFVSRTVGVDYVVERNDDYWGEPATYDTVTFQTVADEDARLNGVLSNSLNVALIAPNQVDAVAGAADVVSAESNGVTFLGMNDTTGPLADERVRRAIELAIDKTSLVDDVLAGHAQVATQMIAPKVAGFDDTIEESAFDVSGAKSLLAEAGYRGEPITLSYASAGRIPLSEELVQAIQQMLQTAGMNIQLEGMDQATLSDRIYSAKDLTGLYLNTYAPSQMDGDPVIDDMFAGGYNDYTMSPETKVLVERTREVAGDERVSAYGELMRYNAAHAQLIPLYVPETNYAVSVGLGFEPRADGLFVFAPTTAKDEG